MDDLTPGTYALYKQPHSDQPPWPVVIYVDDYAPPDFQTRRPNGYVSLVLVIDEPYSFRWAPTSHLSPLISNERRSIPQNNHKLERAFELAEIIKASGLGLEHWRNEVDLQSRAGTLEEPTLGDTDYDDVESDEELNAALRVSRELYYGSSSPSPNQLTFPNVITIDDDDDMEMYSSPPTQTAPNQNKSSTLPKHNDHASPESNTSAPDYSRYLDQRSDSPTLIDEEREPLRSRDFVQVFVGPDSEVRLVPMEDIFERHYFKDQRRGLNLFSLTENNIWKLDHPKLSTIAPRDFDFVVEFLVAGDFGHRKPNDEEEAKETFIQCMSAWKSAEILDMDDLLDFITEKMETKLHPWDPWSVMAFACIVYDPSSVNIPAHDRMKAMLATYLAEKYWSYIEDDDLNSDFLKRLRQLPELDRDIQARRHPAIHPQAGLLEEEDD